MTAIQASAAAQCAQMWEKKKLKLKLAAEKVAAEAQAVQIRNWTETAAEMERLNQWLIDQGFQFKSRSFDDGAVRGIGVRWSPTAGMVPEIVERPEHGLTMEVDLGFLQRMKAYRDAAAARYNFIKCAGEALAYHVLASVLELEGKKSEAQDVRNIISRKPKFGQAATR